MVKQDAENTVFKRALWSPPVADRSVDGRSILCASISTGALVFFEAGKAELLQVSGGADVVADNVGVNAVQAANFDAYSVVVDNAGASAGINADDDDNADDGDGADTSGYVVSIGGVLIKCHGVRVCAVLLCNTAENVVYPQCATSKTVLPSAVNNSLVLDESIATVSKVSCFAWFPVTITFCPVAGVISRALLLVTGDFYGRVIFWAVSLEPHSKSGVEAFDTVSQVQSQGQSQRTLVKLFEFELSHGYQVTSLTMIESYDSGSVGCLLIGTHSGHLLRYNFDVRKLVVGTGNAVVVVSLMYDAILFQSGTNVGVDSLHVADSGTAVSGIVVATSYSRMVVYPVCGRQQCVVPNEVPLCSRHVDQISGIAIAPPVSLDPTTLRWSVYSCGFDGLLFEHIVDSTSALTAASSVSGASSSGDSFQLQLQYIRDVTFAPTHRQCMGICLDPCGLLLACLFLIPGYQHNSRIAQTHGYARQNHVGLCIRNAPRELRPLGGTLRATLGGVGSGICQLDASWIGRTIAVQRVLEVLLSPSCAKSVSGGRIVSYEINDDISIASFVLFFVYSCLRARNELFGSTPVTVVTASSVRARDKDADAPETRTAKKQELYKTQFEQVVRRHCRPPVWARMAHTVIAVLVPAVEEILRNVVSGAVSAVNSVTLLQLMHALSAVTYSLLLASLDSSDSAKVTAMRDILFSIRYLLQGCACLCQFQSQCAKSTLNPQQAMFLLQFPHRLSTLVAKIEARRRDNGSWCTGVSSRFDSSGSFSRLITLLSEDLTQKINQQKSDLELLANGSDTCDPCPVCAASIHIIDGQLSDVTCDACAVSLSLCCFSLRIVDPLGVGSTRQLLKCSLCSCLGYRQHAGAGSSLWCPYCRTVMFLA